MELTPWTLEELSERTAAALRALQLTQENGQVTEVPNARTIRYYATVGLLERPASHGRTAQYGPRHLSQLVAIKRLQAQGLTLTQVQERLLALDAADVDALAALPPEQADAPQHQPIAPAVRTRRADDFWAASPSRPASPEAPSAREPIQPPAGTPAAPVTGITLPEGVTLTFVSAASLSNDDIEAVRAALGPVVDTLRARGLLTPTSDGPRKEEP